MKLNLQNITGPHQDTYALVENFNNDSRGLMIILHGRGASAKSILSLANTLDVKSNYAHLAPQATGRQWYPNGFMAPRSKNQPALDSALQVVGAAVEYGRQENYQAKQIVIGGFSQGACLAAEYLASNPSKFAGLFIFSGGLIGQTVTEADYQGDLQNTPVFIGCGTNDTHIPVARVKQTAKIFRQLKADVELQLYEDMPHTVNQDEIKATQQLLLGES